MLVKPDSHCSFCGHAFAEADPWPRTCAACGETSYRNPKPVAVILQPVDDGVLCIRRAIEPRRGMLALPGGYIDLGESWQAAAARELREEAGLTVDPEGIQALRVLSAPDSTLLVFGIAPALATADLPPFTATPEASERVVLTRVETLAFPLHTQVLRDFLGGQIRALEP